MRQAIVGALILLVTLALHAFAQRIPRTSTLSMEAVARGEWPTYAATPPENALCVTYPPVVVGRFCPELAHTPYHSTRYVGS